MTLDRETKPFVWALLVFVLAWSIIPPLTAPNPPLDSVEGFVWGQSFELGYYKHPPLVAWLYSLVRFLGTGSWTFMWLSAISVATAHIFVWRAARHVVDPLTALWASALMQAIYFHNYFIPEFNQNVIQMPIFAAAGFFAIRALKFGETKDWLALGAVIGIGMWAKYAVAFCAVPIALFFVADPIARLRLKTAGPYLGAALSVLIFAPHIAWMIANQGGTVGYVVERADTAGGGLDHFKFFAECILNGLVVLAIPTLFVWLGRGKAAANPTLADDKSLHRLVFALAFGPLALSAAMALIAGFHIKMAWTSPFWTFAPLALLMLMKPDVSAPRWRIAGFATAFFAGLALTVYAGANVASPYLQHKPMRVHFPGPRLAHETERLWRATSQDRPLRIIIGDTFEAGSAAYFSSAHPLVRIDDDPHKSPWVSDEMKRAYGAMIVWDANKEGDALPQRYRLSSPNAETLGVLELPYLTKAEIAPARIGFARVAPQHLTEP